MKIGKVFTSGWLGVGAAFILKKRDKGGQNGVGAQEHERFLTVRRRNSGTARRSRAIFQPTNVVSGFMCAAVWIVLVAGLSGCGGGGGDGSGGVSESCTAFKVVNGDECTSDTLPVVELLLDDRASCTGTIIAEGVVLTAAHCVANVSRIEAVHDRGRQSASRWIAHPLYNDRSGGAFDLGLIEFLGIATNFGVRPAEFGLSRAPQLGDRLKLVGYGLDGTASLANNNPRGVTVTVRGREQGLLLTSFDADGGGACSGDSGGAATYQGRIVATVHGGRGSCSAGTVIAFVNLTLEPNLLFLRLNLPGLALG